MKKAKVFYAWRVRENGEEKTLRKGPVFGYEWTCAGVDFVVHRMPEKEALCRWAVTEIKSGYKVGRGGGTRKGAILEAESVLECYSQKAIRRRLNRVRKESPPIPTEGAAQG